MAIKNDLPDIFVNKPKRKKKGKNYKVDFHVHVETKNKSFLKMHLLLKALGVKNNKFFLALNDTNLIDVDPYDPTLSLDMKMRILKECQDNFWYFAREIVRLPVAGSDVGTGKQFELHRGNLALMYLSYNNFNSYTELPRQTGKTIGTSVYFVWLFNFGTTNSDMMLVNKEHKDAKENLERVKNIRDVLPPYLQFKHKFSDDGKKLKPDENVESARNAKTRNKITTKPAAMSAEKADKLGRGCTQPVQWFDEFAFLAYNDIIYKSASPAASQASREAKANGKPYSKILTSTPGDMKTPHGKDAFAFIKMSVPFTDDFYDWDLEELREYVKRNSVNGFFYIKYSYKQLGRSEQYFEEQVEALAQDWDKVKREVLLQWNNKAVDSPFDADDLNELDDTKREPIKNFKINDFYKLNIYEEIDYDYPVIISVDVSAAMQKDNSAIAIISTRTKRIVAGLENNKIDTTNLAAVVYTLASKVFPKCIVVVERNGVGEGVVNNLVHTDVKHKLYYETSKDDTKEKLRNGFLQRDTGSDSRVYGAWTGNNRERMFEILGEYVRKYKSRINVDLMVEELKGLQYTKSGRIDHAPGQHDDFVMAFLIGIYVYYERDLSQFGIIRFPDYDNDEISEEQEEQIKAEAERSRNIDPDIYRSMITEMANEHELTEAERAMQQVGQLKTIKDYYDEIDNERLAYNNKQQSTQLDVFKQASGTNIGSNNSFFQNLYQQNTGSNSSDDYEDFVSNELNNYY